MTVIWAQVTGSKWIGETTMVTSLIHDKQRPNEHKTSTTNSKA